MVNTNNICFRLLHKRDCSRRNCTVNVRYDWIVYMKQCEQIQYVSGRLDGFEYVTSLDKYSTWHVFNTTLAATYLGKMRYIFRQKLTFGLTHKQSEPIIPWLARLWNVQPRKFVVIPSKERKTFFIHHSIQTFPGVNPAYCSMGVTVSFITRLNRRAAEQCHSPSYRAEFKKVFSYAP